MAHFWGMENTLFLLGEIIPNLNKLINQEKLGNKLKIEGGLDFKKTFWKECAGSLNLV